MLNFRSLITSALIISSVVAPAQESQSARNFPVYQSFHAPNWLNYIRSGRSFQVIFDIPAEAQGKDTHLGVFLPKGTYTVQPSGLIRGHDENQSVTTSGFHAGQGTFVTETCENPNISKNIINLWNCPLQFTEDGSLFDPTFGKVGILKIDQGIKNLLEMGSTFRVLFAYANFDDTGMTPNDPMGPLFKDAAYTVNYRSRNKTFTVTGFHEGLNRDVTLSSRNANLDFNQISLWGRKYRFDEFGYIYDQDYGMVGYICHVQPWELEQPATSNLNKAEQTR